MKKGDYLELRRGRCENSKREKNSHHFHSCFPSYFEKKCCGRALRAVFLLYCFSLFFAQTESEGLGVIIIKKKAFLFTAIIFYPDNVSLIDDSCYR